MSKKEEQKNDEKGKKITLKHHRTGNFTIIPNSIIMNPNISWKAKVIMAYLLSRPDNWEFYRQEIETRATDRRDSVQSGIKELESNGYLARVPKRGDKGRMDGWEWHIFEDGNGNTFQPKDGSTEGRETRQTDIPPDGKPATINTEKNKTNNTNTDINNNEEVVVHITPDTIVDIFSRQSIHIKKKAAAEIQAIVQKMKIGEHEIQLVAEVLREKYNQHIITNPVGLLMSDPGGIIKSILDGSFYPSSSPSSNDRRHHRQNGLDDPKHEKFFLKGLNDY